jgi:hypothetical protein
VGSGASLVRAVEALAALDGVSLVTVVDVSGHSEAAQYAARLRIPHAANVLEVFRSPADLVAETNGDARLYERLLAVKPPNVEVLSATGLRLLLDGVGSRRPSAPSGAGPRVEIIVARNRLELYSTLREGLAGVPGVEVILDRRRQDRRARMRAQATERRQETRRQRAEIDAALAARGLAVVRREPEPPAP